MSFTFRKKEEEKVTAAIKEAFATVPKPAKQSITKSTCQECTEIRDVFAEQDPDELAPDRM
jgi:hypothetical protein